MKIYNRLVSKFHSDFLASIRDITIPGEKMTIIFITKVKIPEHENFIEFLKTRKDLKLIGDHNEYKSY
jgi:hypothetical protein